MRMKHCKLTVIFNVLMLVSSCSEEPAISSPSDSNPWGRIEAFDLYVAAPEDVLDLIEAPSEITEWHFFGVAAQSILAWLADAGLSPSRFSELSPSRWIHLAGHVVIVPSKEAVLAIKAQKRLRFYRILGRWEANETQQSPAYFPSAGLAQWFAGSGLPDSYLKLIERLVYSENGLSFFADVSLLVGLADSAQEEKAILRLLSRRHTVIARLKISNPSNLKSVVDYWEEGRRRSELHPLLESIIDGDGADWIDVAHLLPPTPRRVLNRFPVLQDGRRGRFPDASWTAFNFFKGLPTDLYTDSPNLLGYLHNHYHQVGEGKATQFGDLIVLKKEGNENPIHICNYVADQFVYSKHGPEPTEPWAIRRMNEVLGLYFGEGETPVIERWHLRH